MRAECKNCGRTRTMKSIGRQLCSTCYKHYLDNPENPRGETVRYDHDDCILESCDKPRSKKAYCSAHWERILKYDDPLEEIPIRESTGRIKRQGRNGCEYWALWMPDHPKANNGYVLEHVYIMMEAGLLTDPDTLHVHHIDHDGLNNSIDNLEVMTHKEHMARHAQENGVTNRYGTFPARAEFCVIEGCGGKGHSGQYCLTHYHRLLRTGDPLGVRRVTANTREPYVLIPEPPTS